MSIKRKTEVYKILIESRPLNKEDKNFVSEELKEKFILEDFFTYYYTKNIHTSSNDKKVKSNSKNICYYIDLVEEDNKIRKVRMKYINFNKKTNVVDIDTLIPTYKKKKNEGDEERQHYLLKTYNNMNRAVLIWEKISGAVSIGMIEKNINSEFRKWIKEKYKENKKEKLFLLQYRIKIYIVPSPDFIEELKTLDKISLIRVTVDKENITKDEDLNFSAENICSDNVEIIYKPCKGLFFPKNKVIDYYKIFEKETRRQRIKRMVISGRSDGNSIALDTERLKLSKYIETKVDIDGMVESNSIFNTYENLVNENFKEYFNNLFLDIINEEE